MVALAKHKLAHTCRQAGNPFTSSLQPPSLSPKTLIIWHTDKGPGGNRRIYSAHWLCLTITSLEQSMLSLAQWLGNTTQAGWSNNGYSSFRPNPTNHHCPLVYVVSGVLVPLRSHGCPPLSPPWLLLATLALPNFTQIFDAKSLISSEFWDKLAPLKGLGSSSGWSQKGTWGRASPVLLPGVSHLTLHSRTRLKQTPSTVNRQTSPRGPSSSAGNIIMTFIDIKALKTHRENHLSWPCGEGL